MKKTYIKPATTVVVLNVRDNVLQVTSPAKTNVNIGENYNGTSTIEAREVIKSQDAWEEW